jgi:hypothetical protein
MRLVLCKRQQRHAQGAASDEQRGRDTLQAIGVILRIDNDRRGIRPSGDIARPTPGAELSAFLAGQSSCIGFPRTSFADDVIRVGLYAKSQDGGDGETNTHMLLLGLRSITARARLVMTRNGHSSGAISLAHCAAPSQPRSCRLRAGMAQCAALIAPYLLSARARARPDRAH